MKALVFLLVFANLVFYAFSAGYFGEAERPDAVRLTQQVSPERLRIVSRGETPEPAPAPSAEQVCLRWSSADAADLERLDSLLKSDFAAWKISRQTSAGEPGGWWVHIPPLASKAAADKKTGELRALGVTDYFVMGDGPTRWAISLGVFSSERGAQDRLEELKVKGVRSARIGERPDKPGPAELRAEGPAVEREALLAAVIAGLPELKSAACR